MVENLEKRTFEGQYRSLMNSGLLYDAKTKLDGVFKGIVGIDINSVSNQERNSGWPVMLEESKFDAVKILFEEYRLRYGLFPANLCFFSKEENKNGCNNNAQGLGFVIWPSDMHDGAMSARLYQPKKKIVRVSIEPEAMFVYGALKKQIDRTSIRKPITGETLIEFVKCLDKRLEQLLNHDFFDLWEFPTSYRLCCDCLKNRLEDVKKDYAERRLQRAIGHLPISDAFRNGDIGLYLTTEKVYP